MSDEEFDLLDNLYFIISFDAIKSELAWEENVLKNKLLDLIQKGWVKCFKKESDDLVEGMADFEHQYKNYNYLATKDGLFAHNSK